MYLLHNKSIAILAPKIHYCIPNESKVNDPCYYIDVNDKIREWFNREDVIEVLVLSVVIRLTVLTCHQSYN